MSSSGLSKPKTIGPPPKERFKNTIIGLSSFCKELCEDLRKKKYNIDTTLVSFAGLYLAQMDDFELIDNFILKSHPYWKEIKEHDENFFINHSDTIFDLPKDQLSIFTDFFLLKDTKNKPVVSKEDKDLIWEYFESLVRISIHHVHEERSPCMKIVDGEEVKNYIKRYIQDLNVANAARKWDVILKWD